MKFIPSYKNKIQIAIILIGVFCMISSCDCANQPSFKTNKTKGMPKTPDKNGNKGSGDKPGDKPEDTSEEEFIKIITKPEIKPTDIQKAQLFIDQLDNAQLKKRYSNNNNILNYAIHEAKPEIAKLLIEKIAALDRTELSNKNNEGYTPLHQVLVILSSTGGALLGKNDGEYMEIAKLLIQQLEPSELSEQDNWGKTPLDYAVKKIGDQPELAELLIEKIATVDISKLNIENTGNSTLLHKLLRPIALLEKMALLNRLEGLEEGEKEKKELEELKRRRIKIMKLLIEKSDTSELCKQDDFGRTPLHYAVEIVDEPELAKLLIDKIATVDKSKLAILDNAQHTPLAVSRGVGNRLIAQILSDKLRS
ncbi:MAG: hypothetical protein BGO68_04110 [Candidatus Amoebophilus sp. 36-38]|nr:MAG: hypothetical protein BGO68_04110 [Candidatus Amoebophilus sp. 36-38]